MSPENKIAIPEAVDTGLVPVEEAVEHMVPQTSKYICLPTRYKAGGQSHPCTICNSLHGGGGRIHMCMSIEPSFVFPGRSGGLGCKWAINLSVQGRISNVPVTPHEKGGLTLMQLATE
eukprot:1707691-Ditylum_brightwellii.AAC.1